MASGVNQARPIDQLSLRPSYKQKASAATMKAIIRDVLDSHLKGQTFVADHTAEWTKGIANEVRDKLKGLALGRYKYLVQVVMGEQRGQGVRMGCRCFWDSETDTEASEVFINDKLFCVATAYAVYLY